ncbi:MAG TPA: hypothetical protein VFH80_27965 [Solirubrobacteraceae bacterium]|nr:hypothetical protein [Solirubrobacteraceae bacterium]
MQHLELAGVRRSVLVAVGIAFLIPVVVAVWALTQIGGSDSKSGTDSAKGGQTTPHHATAASFRQTPLFKGLVAANQSAYAKNLLPPSSCQGMSATMVVCKQPHYAVSEVTFATYPSLKSLYAAYEARAGQLAQAPFRANTGNCTEGDVNGEIAWNHDFKHPSMYPISMFTSGTITDDKAAGRMFCTFTGGLLYLLWTQDDGRILGELAGAPHLDAYLWWHNVHHVIAIPGTPNMMGSMPAMGNTTSTQSSSTMPSSTSTMPKSKSAMPSGHGTTSTKSSHSMPGMGSGMTSGG